VASTRGEKGPQLELRPLGDASEYLAAVHLQQTVWGPEETTPANQMMATAHSGGLVLGAFQGSELVGFALAWPGRSDGESLLYSHMLAVSAHTQGQGIGRALKWRQREWAMAEGYRRMAWTYDPLRRHNARFNLEVLGAEATRLIPNCYGAMTDRLNWGLDSDRFWVEWQLDHPLVEARRLGKTLPKSSDEGIWVEIPKDMEALKQADLEQARALQQHFRQAVEPLFAAGLRALAVRDRGMACAYLFSRR
jgi:predicted GNAT superfamily acetyltransferase